MLLPSFPSTDPLSLPPSHCFYEGVPPPHHPTHFCLTALAFLYAGASRLHRTKGLPSHWCQIRQSSAKYAAGAMDPSLVRGLVPGSSGRSSWLILLFLLWDCKLLHWCPSTHSDGWLWASASILVRLWQSSTGDSYSVIKHFLASAIVSGFGVCSGMDP